MQVDGPDRNDGTATLTTSMAARFDAHLIGVAVIGCPLERYFGDSFSANAAILIDMLAHVNEGDSHCWPLRSQREIRFSWDLLLSLRDTFQPHQKVIADRRTRYDGRRC